jgi:hypothetical protein
MKNEPGQLNTLVGNKRKSNEDCIASTIKDAPENKRKGHVKLHITAVTTMATPKKVLLKILGGKYCSNCLFSAVCIITLTTLRR